MSRWQPDARERLERAAIDLFTEQGFADTTVPQITARAGLTTRTFFRHFADKREVLFGAPDMVESAAALPVDVPADAAPMTVVLAGLRAVADARFEGRREELRRRRVIIRSDPALRERELHKHAVVADAVRDGLRERGLEPVAAELLGRTAAALLFTALEQWLDRDDARTLADLVTDAAAVLRTAVADDAQASGGGAAR